MIDTNDVLQKIKSLFSEKGLQIQNATIKLENPIDVNISISDKSVKILFPKNKPSVKIKKIISFSVTLSGIDLSESGGVLEIDNFPDIPFKYDWILNE
jgi:hypothetical protein